MARWLVIQLDGKERRVPKSVALLAIRRNEVTQVGPRVVVEKFLRAVPSSLPGRFDQPSLNIVRVDPLEVLKRAFQESQGLLVNYPIKDQRSKRVSSRKLGRTPKPGVIAGLDAKRREV